MNTEFIRKVRARIRREPARLFNMNFFRARECGTPCCIAGWACRIDIEQGTFDKRLYKTLGTEAYAARLFHLPFAEAHKLFMPDVPVHLSTLSKAQALRTLTKLLLTGEVDWHVTNSELKKLRRHYRAYSGDPRNA